MSSKVCDYFPTFSSLISELFLLQSHSIQQQVTSMAEYQQGLIVPGCLASEPDFRTQQLWDSVGLDGSVSHFTACKMS